MEIVIETLVAGTCTYVLLDGDKVVLRGEAPTGVIARAQVKAWLMGDAGPFKKYRSISDYRHASGSLSHTDFTTGEVVSDSDTSSFCALKVA